jgi:DNA topoisomerase-1
LLKEGKNGEFLACSGYPKCRYTRQVNPNYLDISCPECEKRVIAFTHVKTPYYRCEDYPKCKFSVKSLPTKDKTCPKCGYRLAERVFKGQNILECLKCKFKIEN